MTDEVLKTVPPVDAPAATDPDKKQVAAERRRERAAKKEKDRLWREYVRGLKVRPESEKRMICPPDRATFTKGKTVRGYISRIAVIIFAAFGVSFLLCNAFAIGEGADGLSPGWRLFLCSVLFTALVSLTQILKPRAVAIPAGTLITLGVFILFFLPDPFVRMFESAIAGYNSALDHLTKVGFYAAYQSRIEYAYTTGSESELALRALVAGETDSGGDPVGRDSGPRLHIQYFEIELEHFNNRSRLCSDSHARRVRYHLQQAQEIEEDDFRESALSRKR